MIEEKYTAINEHGLIDVAVTTMVGTPIHMLTVEDFNNQGDESKEEIFIYQQNMIKAYEDEYVALEKRFAGLLMVVDKKQAELEAEHQEPATEKEKETHKHGGKVGSEPYARAKRKNGTSKYHYVSSIAGGKNRVKPWRWEVGNEKIDTAMGHCTTEIEAALAVDMYFDRINVGDIRNRTIFPEVMEAYNRLKLW